MPFYKFGDTMYLSKISRADWISLIVTALDETQKHISEELADKIAANVQDHSYYVQQLSHMVWINTDREVSPAIVDQVLENLLQQNAILYTRDKEDLSATQLAYMKALASGVTSGLNSRAMIERFRLGTSASVTKAKRALLDKELIEERGGNYYFLDPVYELWFRRLIRR